MSCGNQCADWQCGKPGAEMNTIQLTPGDEMCLDCGEAHRAGPCQECECCDRLFFGKDIRATMGPNNTEYWCTTCLEHRFDGEEPVRGVNEQLEFGWLVNK